MLHLREGGGPHTALLTRPSPLDTLGLRPSFAISHKPQAKTLSRSQGTTQVAPSWCPLRASLTD